MDLVRCHPARQDPEYARGGVANLFLVTEPLRRWQDVRVSQQRARINFAACVKHVADVHYPDAERIVLVLDQRYTHAPASLSAVFPAAKAKWLPGRLEVHDTPKHGSRLNMAELELAVLQRQCLAQRLLDGTTMKRAVSAWAARRNAAISAIT